MENYLKLRYVLFSVFRWTIYKLFYGKAFIGPVLGLGPDVRVRLRNGGSIKFGKIKSRGISHIFCDGGHLKIGSNVFMNRGVSINCVISISIADKTLFGENVKIYDHNHVVNDDYHVDPILLIRSPIEIGEGCWLSSNVVILKGVKISNNSIVGAGSVITSSIAAPGIYFGSGNNLTRIR